MPETWSPPATSRGLEPPGDGWTITGYQTVMVNEGGNKYNNGMPVARQIPIYTRLGDPAPAAPPAPPPSDPVKDAQDAIAAAQNRPVAAYPTQAAPPAPAAPDPMAGVTEAMNAQAAQYQQQMQALQQLMIQQQSQYQSQMAEAQRQQAAMAAQAAESSRQAAALQRAFVPNLEPTATAPSIGDTRMGSETRSAAANTLSNLAILTGVGGSASGGVTSTLAGLQIA